jgi:Flp pilus assembly pilin Flp
MIVSQSGISNIRKGLRRFTKSERGATSMEYALICFVILVVAAAGFKKLGTAINNGANKASTELK